MRHAELPVGARARAVRVVAVVMLAVGAVGLTVSRSPARAGPRSTSLGAAVGPIRLVPTSRNPTVVAGLNGYFGSVLLDPQAGGLVVSNRLTLERYVLGLNEVPPEWPEEALRAQAVAARTYALHTLSRPRSGDAATYGFDICATTDCQVFSGADVVTSADGERWKQAVVDTSGEVMTYDGAPILARYHSTSGGRTLGNSEGFPGEPDYPYLRPVTSATERAAPLWRWTVSFSLGDLERLVAEAGWWAPALGSLRAAYTAPSRQGYYYPDVVLVGERGRVRRTTNDLQDVAIDLAPALFPGRYPSIHPEFGALPVTLPSNRFSVDTRGHRVVVRGRGFGHGVGMSQYGAHGLARQGISYEDILTHYYTGATVAQTRGSPRIEVGVATGLSSVNVTGAFEIVDGRGRTLVEDALGTWQFRTAGPGVVSIDPPAGHGLPLQVGIVRAPRVVGVGEPVSLTVALSRPARVKTLTSAAPGGFEDPGSRIRNGGRRRVVWLAPVEAGTYRVTVRASTATVTRQTEPVEIEVRDETRAGRGEEGNEDGVSSAPEGDDDSGSSVPIVVALVVALTAGAAVYAALGPPAGRMKQ